MKDPFQPQAILNSSPAQARKTSKTHSPDHIDDGRIARVLSHLGPVAVGHEGPQLVRVDGRTVARVLLHVEVPHAHLAEVPRVVLVPVDPVMVLTAGVT